MRWRLLLRLIALYVALSQAQHPGDLQLGAFSWPIRSMEVALETQHPLLCTKNIVSHKTFVLGFTIQACSAARQKEEMAHQI